MTLTDKEINKIMESVIESLSEDREKEMNDVVNQYMAKVSEVSDDEASLRLRGYVATEN